MRLHVGRADELALFKHCLEGAGAPHVLLIRAEAGMGKTALLAEFLAQATPHASALVDFKAGTHTIPRVLCELSASLDATGFAPFFEAQRRTLAIQLADNKIVKSKLDIGVHVHRGSLDAYQLELRVQELTHAFFAQLVRTNPHGHPTVLMFDTFERASPDVQDWLSGPFLTFAHGHRWLVTVIAGQAVPEPRLGWDDWCTQHDLQPLDYVHVCEWVSRVCLELSPEEVAFLYDTTDGIPLDLSIQLGRLRVKRSGSHADC